MQSIVAMEYEYLFVTRQKPFCQTISPPLTSRFPFFFVVYLFIYIHKYIYFFIFVHFVFIHYLWVLHCLYILPLSFILFTTKQQNMRCAAAASLGDTLKFITFTVETRAVFILLCASSHKNIGLKTHSQSMVEYRC